MSLLNVIRQWDRAHIITDGAVFDENTRIVAFMPKVHCLPQLNAAVGFRGDAMISQHLASMFQMASGKYKTFEGLRRSIVKDTRDLLNALIKNAHVAPNHDALEMEIAVAGWSEWSGAETFYFHTGNSPEGPWKIITGHDLRCSPSTPKIADQIFEHLNVSRPLMPEAIISAAEIQRWHMEPMGPKQLLTSWVGGFLQVTTVTRDEITTKVIHRWPDQIGERIMRQRADQRRPAA